MRFIRRLELSPSTERVLSQRTDKVQAADDPKGEAARLWRSKSNKAFDEIRTRLREMATGVERCMYCEDSAGTDIEHFYPKAHYPERAFEWENYLHACSHCNSNEKRGQFPLDGNDEPLLIDPTAEDPMQHLRFSPSTGEFESVSLKGKSSIEVFGLDRSTLVRGRANAWVKMTHLLKAWARLRQDGDDQSAARVRRALVEHPFSSVLAYLIRMSRGPRSQQLVQARVLRADVVAVLEEHPEIKSWLE